MTQGTSSPGSSRAFAEWDPDSSSWRTFEDTFDLGLTPSSVSFPTSGMTRAGFAYELPTWAPATTGNDSSSPPLLSTPRAREMEESPQSFADRQGRLAEQGRTKGDSGMPLSVQVLLL